MADAAAAATPGLFFLSVLGEPNGEPMGVLATDLTTFVAAF